MNSEGIILPGGWSGTGYIIPTTYSNISFNASPFKTMQITYWANFTNNSGSTPYNASVVLRAVSLGKTTIKQSAGSSQHLTNLTLSLDLSDINEQIFLGISCSLSNSNARMGNLIIRQIALLN